MASHDATGTEDAGNEDEYVGEGHGKGSEGQGNDSEDHGEVSEEQGNVNEEPRPKRRRVLSKQPTMDTDTVTPEEDWFHASQHRDELLEFVRTSTLSICSRRRAWRLPPSRKLAMKARP